MAIQELKDLIFFIERLSRESNVDWSVPINPRKWCINEIISHIWLWDKYSLDLMLPLMREGATLRFIDQGAINSNAESFSRTLKNSNELIHIFNKTRNKLINNSAAIDNKIQFYVGKKEYNIESYIKKFITSHDQHHMQQIEEFLN
jgi:hypothetical protein